jgi:hypothetical protein
MSIAHLNNNKIFKFTDFLVKESFDPKIIEYCNGYQTDINFDCLASVKQDNIYYVLARIPKDSENSSYVLLILSKSDDGNNDFYDMAKDNQVDFVRYSINYNRQYLKITQEYFDLNILELYLDDNVLTKFIHA